MSAFKVISLAAKALLEQSPAVAPVIERNRLRPFPAGVFTAIAIRTENATPDRGNTTGGLILWATELRIECYARGLTTVDPMDVVDPLLEAVYARLLSDTTLGGKTGSLEVGPIEWEFNVDGENTTCVTLSFTVNHASNHASLAPLS